MKNGTARKTESLAYPSNPLAAMRELQELDAIPSPPEQHEPEPAVASATALQVAPATGSQVSSVTSSDEAKAADAVPGKAELPARKKHRRESEREAEHDAANPMERALLEMLARPYDSDVTKGPFTVTTVKIPSDLWERLGWLSQVTGQTKQEIIALALQDRFEKVGKGK
jgi:hypothetical protein